MKSYIVKSFKSVRIKTYVNLPFAVSKHIITKVRNQTHAPMRITSFMSFRFENNDAKSNQHLPIKAWHFL